MRLLQPGRRNRNENGVVAIVVAIVTCFTLIPLAAYAVDIGVQRVARRDVQAKADVIALDLARQLDGRTYAQLHASLQTLANKSAARNNATGMTVVPELGTLGTYSPTNPASYFTPTTVNTVVPTAVRVTVSTSVNFSLHGGSGGVVRSAVARSQATACFSIGSFALNLDSSKSLLLNGLINDSLNLSAISYTGLANANITLLGLATELGVGSPSELASLSTTWSLNQFYLALAHVLQAQGGEAADVTLLNQLAAASFGGLPNISVGSLLELGTASQSALDASVNVLDLVSTSAFVANGTNALAVPSLTAGIPNVAGVTASLKVIEKPKGGCFRVGGTVQTSQVDLDLTFTLANLNVLTLVASSTLTLHVSLAQALGTLTNIQCGNPYGVDVSVASALSQLSSHLRVDLKLLGIPIAYVDVNPATNAPAATNTVQFRHPPTAYDSPVSAGSGVALSTVSMTSTDIVLLGFLPLSLGGLTSALLSVIVDPIVNPLIANVNAVLVGPLSRLLGLELGGADVFVHQPPPHACDGVAMAG